MTVSATAAQFADGWADNWPDMITLGEAAEEIDFDLHEGDDPEVVLVKRDVPVDEYYKYPRSMLDELDGAHQCIEFDRSGRIEEGLHGFPENVPPVVLLDGDLLDGNHRVSIAHEAGRVMVPAYVPMPDDCEIRDGDCLTHKHI